MKGLFINSQKGVCSIYEVGYMSYDILKRSSKYTLDYVDVQPPDLGFGSYDFIIINYHFATNKWMDATFVAKCKCPVIALVLEVGFDDPLSKTPHFFDHYLVLDPSLAPSDKMTVLPRPLDTFPSSAADNNNNHNNHNNNNIPVIGSFGFATDGKKWHEIVECVNKDFDEAIIRFNIPHATFVPSNGTRIKAIENACKQKITKPGISLEITSENFSRQQLVDWCAQNTINCFFYFRQDICPTGLSAVTDQAVAAGKPVLVTTDKTFRHLHPYLPAYPNINIKDAIEKMNKEKLVDKIIKDWHPQRFIAIFENTLSKCIGKKRVIPPLIRPVLYI